MSPQWLGGPGDLKTQRGIIDGGFDLLKKKIDDMTTVNLTFRLREFEFFQTHSDSL